MLVTLPSVGMALVLQPKISVFVAVSIKQFPALWYLVFSLPTIMLVSPVQSAKAREPMLVTPLPIVTLVSPVQPRKAYDGMIFTFSPILTVARLEQPLNIG